MKGDDGKVTKDERQRRSHRIQSVSVAARFLRILANAEGPMTLGDLARHAKAGAPTTHRYLQSLLAEDLVVQDTENGRYDLGPAVLSLGVSALRRIDAVEVAARRMKDLASRISASCGVAIWTERGPTIVRWYRSASFTLSTVALGDVLPMNNTACGLVFQAFLPDETTRIARDLQPHAFRGKAPSKLTLAAIREAGGFELNERLFASLTGKAAAIFNAHNEIACVATTVSLVSVAEAENHRDLLFGSAREASLEAGGARQPQGARAT